MTTPTPRAPVPAHTPEEMLTLPLRIIDTANGHTTAELLDVTRHDIDTALWDKAQLIVRAVNAYPSHQLLLEALKPLAAIADAFDKNELDEARPTWGNTRESAAATEILSGRGGKQLLTLADAFKARAALASAGKTGSQT